MRAVFSTFCLAGFLAAVVSTPLSREKRFAGVWTSAGNPFLGAGALAGFPFGGAVAATPYGTVFTNPMLTAFNRPAVSRTPPVYPTYQDYNPFPFFGFPPFPTFNIPVFKNWYEGENVCKEEKVMNSQLRDDVIPDDWKDDMPNVSTDFSHEQESCKGTDKKYVCVKRVMGSSGEAQIIATKYECCHGFVRDPTGAPGCVESKQPNSSGSNSKLTPNDPTYYVYSGNNMQAGSSSVSKSSGINVDKVPSQ